MKQKYLHAKSHHYPPKKTGVINTMVVRAKRISDKAHLKHEIDHLADVFRRNGYNENQYKRIVTRSMANNKRIVKRDDNYEGKKIFLPYIKGTTDKLAKTLKRKNFIFIFSFPNTRIKMVDSLKYPIDPGAYKGVYSIPCSCGKEYICETG